MSWIDSDLVQKEAEECNYLRKQVEQLLVVAEETANEDIALEYYHTLYAMLEKQETIYMRIQLLYLQEDDEIALELKNKIIGEMILQGMPPYMGVLPFLVQVKKDIRRELTNLTNEDLDLPPEIDYNI